MKNFMGKLFSEMRKPNDQRDKEFSEAFKNKDLAGLKKAIEHGVDINMIPKFGVTTYLNAASASGDVEIVKLLLDHGANPEITDIRNLGTSLMCAVKSNNIEVVKLLLDNGAKINVKNSFGDTPLEFALMRNYGDVANLLKTYKQKKKTS